MKLSNYGLNKWWGQVLQGYMCMIARPDPGGTFVGEAAALPSRIRIRELSEEQLPDSNDIKFAEGWSNPATTGQELGAIVERWCGTN